MRTPVGPSLHLVLLLGDAFAEISIRSVSALWNGWTGSGRFHRKLAQFTREGWVETSMPAANTERVVRITEAGRAAALGGRNPEACWRRAWDGQWRLVLFDVPEARRALRMKLQRQLRALHFGYLQNSVWLTPDSLETLKRIVGDASIDVETLTFMEARPCGGETDAELVAGAWDFRKINRGYEHHLEVLHRAPLRAGGAARRNWLEIEWKAWYAAVRNDPLLPGSLLPQMYRGTEAWRRRNEILRRVLDGC